jgi:hypothetical protein
MMRVAATHLNVLKPIKIDDGIRAVTLVLSVVIVYLGGQLYWDAPQPIVLKL